MVTQQGGVERLPAAPFVAHLHKIGEQNMIVRLGVATSRCRMAGHGPGEPAGRRTHLRPSPPPAVLLDDVVQVGHGGVPLGVQDGVHVLGPAHDPQLGHRLVAADH
jgi:hypothetical protein